MTQDGELSVGEIGVQLSRKGRKAYVTFPRTMIPPEILSGLATETLYSVVTSVRRPRGNPTQQLSPVTLPELQWVLVALAYQRYGADLSETKPNRPLKLRLPGVVIDEGIANLWAQDLSLGNAHLAPKLFRDRATMIQALVRVILAPASDMVTRLRAQSDQDRAMWTLFHPHQHFPPPDNSVRLAYTEGFFLAVGRDILRVVANPDPPGRYLRQLWNLPPLPEIVDPR